MSLQNNKNLINVLLKNGTFNATHLNVMPNAEPNVKKNWQFLSDKFSVDNQKLFFVDVIQILLVETDTKKKTDALGLLNKLAEDLSTKLNEQNGLSGLSGNLSGQNCKINKGRIVIALPDGTVIYDSNSTDNTDFTKIKINKNHNSRIAVLTAQALQSGVGYESKYSCSVKQFSDYVAFRIGKLGQNMGTVIYSTYKTVDSVKK